jgi:hypothetical protein
LLNGSVQQVQGVLHDGSKLNSCESGENSATIVPVYLNDSTGIPHEVAG